MGRIAALKTAREITQEEVTRIKMKPEVFKIERDEFNQYWVEYDEEFLSSKFIDISGIYLRPGETGQFVLKRVDRPKRRKGR